MRIVSLGGHDMTTDSDCVIILREPIFRHEGGHSAQICRWLKRNSYMSLRPISFGTTIDSQQLFNGARIDFKLLLPY